MGRQGAGCIDLPLIIPADLERGQEAGPGHKPDLCEGGSAHSALHARVDQHAQARAAPG